jgi:hypothetical protein
LRLYFDGPSLAIAARTVFREIPNVRAIALVGIFSARYNRRISAQFSTESTPSTPWLGWSQSDQAEGSKFGCHAGVSIHALSHIT